MRMFTTAMAETYAPEHSSMMILVCLFRSLIAARIRGLFRRRRMPRVRFARASPSVSGVRMLSRCSSFSIVPLSA